MEIGIPEGYQTVACLILRYDSDPDQELWVSNKDVVNYVK